jgi:hypothetical protein
MLPRKLTLSEDRPLETEKHADGPSLEKSAFSKIANDLDTSRLYR